ncbi:hypothetical protein FQA47_014189 [Oryzias melastigma]|uniref:Uncharacterized protein n=1 Tax=Oryzias melastigma TaxID=30732 RepID=A0A834FN01_ORYME|nr:hypothetical protein FQA47_014189 [Oryzias melastigma]
MSEKGKGRRRKQGRQPVAPDHQTASRSPGAVRTDGAELGEPTAEAGQRLFLSVFIFLLFFSLTVEEPMRERLQPQQSGGRMRAAQAQDRGVEMMSMGCAERT